MARGALVRLQARDGFRTSDNEPSVACRASASITGCVRKLFLRLRPSAYLTRDHRLGLAIALRLKTHGAETPPPLGSRASPSAIPSLRSALTSFGGYSAHGTLGPTFRYGALFFVASALADVPSARLTLSATENAAANWERRHLGGVPICDLTAKGRM